MTLSRSPVRVDGAVGTTPTDHRRAIAASFARASSSVFGVRPGTLWGCVVTGTAGWNYSVAPGSLVTVRSTLQGAYPAAIEGATTVATDPAPGSGSRIDIIYALQHDLDTSDADNLAILGCAIGTASGSPVAPSIPAGALELARNTMTSSATTTASAGNTIVHTSAPITSLHGGFFEVATVADLARIVSPLVGDRAKVIADGGLREYRSSAWIPVGVTSSRFVRSAGSDSNVTTGTDVNLVSGTITGARPGMWLISGRASLYTSGSSCVGHVYVQWASGGGGATQEKARWDIPNSGGTYPQSAPVQRVITHTGGDLAIDCGYSRSAGGYWVTGNPSGLTVVEATYLGPAL